MIGIFNKPSMNTYNAGTGAYRAPEIRKEELYPSSDTYCLGKTMFDLLQANNLLTSDRDFAVGWESLAIQMIAKDPIKRPSLPQIVLSLHHLKENKKLPGLNHNISNNYKI
jgi:serine/threonine protein kinase